MRKVDWEIKSTWPGQQAKEGEPHGLSREDLVFCAGSSRAELGRQKPYSSKVAQPASFTEVKFLFRETWCIWHRSKPSMAVYLDTRYFLLLLGYKVMNMLFP